MDRWVFPPKMLGLATCLAGNAYADDGAWVPKGGHPSPPARALLPARQPSEFLRFGAHVPNRPKALKIQRAFW